MIVHFSAQAFKKRFEWDWKESWGTDGSAERRAGKHGRGFLTNVSADYKIVVFKTLFARWLPQENIRSTVHMTKSVEAARAHLQGQLRNKEAENNRLTVQLRVQNMLSACCSLGKVISGIRLYIYSVFVCFLDSGENNNWTEDGNWWSESVHDRSVWDNQTGQRGPQEGHASSETSGWEIWSRYWKMLCAVERKGINLKKDFCFFFTNTVIVQDLIFLRTLCWPKPNQKETPEDSRRRKRQMRRTNWSLILTSWRGWLFLYYAQISMQRF